MRGAPRTLASIDESLRLAAGMRERFLDPAGGLGPWITKFHGGDFQLRESPEGPVVELTTDGASKYGLKDVQVAGANAAEETTTGLRGEDDSSRELRAAVFGELAAKAAQRSGT